MLPEEAQVGVLAAQRRPGKNVRVPVRGQPEVCFFFFLETPSQKVFKTQFVITCATGKTWRKIRMKTSRFRTRTRPSSTNSLFETRSSRKMLVNLPKFKNL